MRLAFHTEFQCGSILTMKREPGDAVAKVDGNVATHDRAVTGAIVRGFASALEKRGLTKGVLAEASPEAKAMLSRPPLHFSWAPAVHYEELVSRGARLAGPGNEHLLGRELVVDGVGPILRPLLKTVTGLLGGGPAAFLKGLPRAVPMQYRGVAFAFREEGPRRAVLTIDYGAPIDPIIFKVWAGSLAFGDDIHGIPTQISLFEVSPDQRKGHFRISW